MGVISNPIWEILKSQLEITIKKNSGYTQLVIKFNKKLNIKLLI